MTPSNPISSLKPFLTIPEGNPLKIYQNIKLWATFDFQMATAPNTLKL